MEKVEFIKKYFASTRALYLDYIGEMNNDIDLKKYIVEKDNIIGATISLFTIIMLGIKEDIVSNEGNLNYESKLFFDYLEKSVEYIAKKENDKYYLDGYEFNDAASVVAMIRNKIAHGKYIVDFSTNKLVLKHDSRDLRINIEKLKLFIITAFMHYTEGIQSKEYKRSFCIYEKAIPSRTAPIKTISELKSVIRNIKYYSFELSCDNGDVPLICVTQLKYYISLIKNNIEHKKLFEVYKNLVEFLNNYSCVLKVTTKKMKNEQIEEKLLSYSQKMLLDKNIAYLDQITILGDEILKQMETYYTKFDPLFSNIKYIIVLDAIKKCGTSNKKVVSDYLIKQNYSKLYINYDEIATIIINMFNSLYIYGLDDIYTECGGYKLDRSNEFDFSTLDLDSLTPIIDGIDYSPLNNSKSKYDSTNKKYNELINLIETKNNNLSNINGNEYAKNKIQKKIDELNIELTELNEVLLKDRKVYLNIVDDYVNNQKHFRNKAIINGIRNSISHGHYEIISGNDFSNSKIIFSDIYQGKLTFKIELSFKEFIDLIENNFQIIFNYLEEKKKSDSLVKKLNSKS